MEQNDYIQIGEPHRYIEKTMSLCGSKQFVLIVSVSLFIFRRKIYIKMLKSLNSSIKVGTFVSIVPAKPLYNAQIGRSSLFMGLDKLFLIY